MNKVYLYSAYCLSFLLFVATLHGAASAASSSSSSEASSQMKIKLHLVDGSNPERNCPVIKDTLDLERKETFTKKTFASLRDEAFSKRVPWVLMATLDVAASSKNVSVDYFDVTSLMAEIDTSIQDTHEEVLQLVLGRILEQRRRLGYAVYSKAQILLNYPHHNTHLIDTFVGGVMDGQLISEASYILQLGRCWDYDKVWKLGLLCFVVMEQNADYLERGVFWMKQLADGPDNPYKERAIGILGGIEFRRSSDEQESPLCKSKD